MAKRDPAVLRGEAGPSTVARGWPEDFARRLIDWQRRCGRHDLPWQGGDAYAVWVSEVMLQQTQVATVLQRYPRFVARFPDFASLAAATLDEVLAQWSGLGYYRRARQLHAAARLVVQQRGGCLPQSAAEWAQLPGVGRSTAAAIAAFTRGERAAILDGNVRRVLGRLFAAELGPEPSPRAFWSLAERLLPDAATAAHGGMAAYTQGLMDLGATLCTPQRPSCAQCPFRAECPSAAGAAPPAAARRAQVRARERRSERVVMLLLRRADGSLLFEQRAPVGIWPGLWCPPQAPDIDAAGRLAAALLGLHAPPALAAGAALKHSFTHFDLWVTPAWIDLPADAPVRQASDAAPPLRWLAPAQFGEVGMPALVDKLLAARNEHAGRAPPPARARPRSRAG